MSITDFQHSIDTVIMPAVVSTGLAQAAHKVSCWHLLIADRTIQLRPPDANEGRILPPPLLYSAETLETLAVQAPVCGPGRV